MLLVMKKQTNNKQSHWSHVTTNKVKPTTYKSTYLQYLAEQEIKYYSKEVLDNYTHSHLNAL